jgi:hypothetical protein
MDNSPQSSQSTQRKNKIFVTQTNFMESQWSLRSLRLKAL